MKWVNIFFKSKFVMCHPLLGFCMHILSKEDSRMSFAISAPILHKVQTTKRSEFQTPDPTFGTATDRELPYDALIYKKKY